MATYLDTICTRLVASGTMAPRTLDDYRSKTRLWIVPLLGQHRLDRLLADHLDRAYRKMFEAGLSSSTVLKVHRILSRALAIAVRRDLVARNVTKLVADINPGPGWSNPEGLTTVGNTVNDGHVVCTCVGISPPVFKTYGSIS